MQHPDSHLNFLRGADGRLVWRAPTDPSCPSMGGVIFKMNNRVVMFLLPPGSAYAASADLATGGKVRTLGLRKLCSATRQPGPNSRD